ncbi:hypothetical protein [Curtobacterium sp. UCD-KPL2560]|uniref:hypothetical protein n=1 Tax=unclassified Curtobacterium TaxID=257496 RepID=UPI000826ED2C|nr:hypothetical protein [Curtobacterium sp. UCD-KPL2560]
MPRISKTAALAAVGLTAAGGALVPSVASAAEHPVAYIPTVDGQQPVDYQDRQYVFTPDSGRPAISGWAAAATTIRFVEGDQTLCEVAVPARQAVACTPSETLSPGMHTVTTVTVQDGTEQRWLDVKLYISEPAPAELQAIATDDGATVSGTTNPDNEVEARVERGGAYGLVTPDADGRFSLSLRGVRAGDRVLVRSFRPWHGSKWVTVTVTGDAAAPEPVVAEPSDGNVDPGFTPGPGAAPEPVVAQPSDGNVDPGFTPGPGAAPEPVVAQPSDGNVDPGFTPVPGPGAGQGEGEQAADSPVRVTDVAADGSITLTATSPETRFLIGDEEGNGYANIVGTPEGKATTLRNIPASVRKLVVKYMYFDERFTITIPGR